jgi:hypothetical protein
MNTPTSSLIDDVLLSTKAWTVDVPLTTTQWAVGIGTEEVATSTAWRGYDATIRLLTGVVDAWYRTPSSALVFSWSMNAALGWQQLHKAATSMLFTGLRHGNGIPTAGSLQELQASMPQRAAEVHEQREHQEQLRQQSTPVPRSAAGKAPRHSPKLHARRHPRPNRQLSLPVKQLAHHHGH